MRQIVSACIFVLALGCAACSEEPGSVPTPTAEQQNKMQDLRRDLWSLVSGSRGAVQDLADDLGNLSPYPPDQQVLLELSKRLSSCLAKASFSEQAAGQLAERLYKVMNGRALNREQMRTLQTDVGTVLKSVGADDARIGVVAEQVAAVARAIKGKSERRWWQVFGG